MIEVYGSPASPCPLVVTCEHGGNRLPNWLSAQPADRPWLESHWGWDLGAVDLSRVLAERSGGIGVFCQTSRLVCDCNRPVDHPCWIRQEVEGHPLSFNQALDDLERQRRRHEIHDAFHAAVDQVLAQRRQDRALLLSVHSFTPQLGGDRRWMDVGVLFDDHRPLAETLAALLGDRGLRPALNEPYSGYDGLIYSANRQGRAHAVAYLELEVRQDLLLDPASFSQIADAIYGCLPRLFDACHERDFVVG
jgi:predicted N-formylglutamate amidohydrolase